MRLKLEKNRNIVFCVVKTILINDELLKTFTNDARQNSAVSGRVIRFEFMDTAGRPG